MRFALLDVLTVGGSPRADHEVLPAPPPAPADGRVESDALAVMAAEIRHLREQEHALQRRQAESLETVAEALSRLVDGREAPAAHDELEALRQAHDRDAAELEALREAQSRHAEERARNETELEAARAELTEARAKADRATRRLASTQDKLRRARDELSVAQAPWWRRRRARAGLD